VRLDEQDHAGVLEANAQEFASENISIESVVQKGRATAETVPLVIMTHEAEEAAVSRAVRQLEGLDAVRPPVQRIRIEDLL
jgi:homoserine dehydrogenase